MVGLSSSHHDLTFFSLAVCTSLRTLLLLSAAGESFLNALTPLRMLYSTCGPIQLLVFSLSSHFMVPIKQVPNSGPFCVAAEEVQTLTLAPNVRFKFNTEGALKWALELAYVAQRPGCCN